MGAESELVEGAGEVFGVSAEVGVGGENGGGVLVGGGADGHVDGVGCNSLGAASVEKIGRPLPYGDIEGKIGNGCKLLLYNAEGSVGTNSREDFLPNWPDHDRFAGNDQVAKSECEDTLFGIQVSTAAAQRDRPDRGVDENHFRPSL